jgi:hypothetical protein
VAVLAFECRVSSFNSLFFTEISSPFSCLRKEWGRKDEYPDIPVLKTGQVSERFAG